MKYMCAIICVMYFMALWPPNESSGAINIITLAYLFISTIALVEKAQK